MCKRRRRTYILHTPQDIQHILGRELSLHYGWELAKYTWEWRRERIPTTFIPKNGGEAQFGDRDILGVRISGGIREVVSLPEVTCEKR